MDIYGIFQYRNILDTSAPRSNCDRFVWARKREMEALLQAASEDTREAPLSDNPGYLDYDGDMAQLMRGVYSAFKSEVSGAGSRADARPTLASSRICWLVYKQRHKVTRH